MRSPPRPERGASGVIHRARCAAALLALLVAALHAPSLGVGFVAEDWYGIARAHDALARDAWLAPFAPPGDGPRFYRPLVGLVHIGSYAVFGTDPTGPHLLEIALFALGCLLWLRLLLRLDVRPRAAFASALALAVFPTVPEVVGWISAVNSLLGLLLVLIAANLAASARRAAVVLAPLALAPAFLAHEWTVPFGLLLVLVRAQQLARWRVPRCAASALRELALLWPLAAAYVALRAAALRTALGGYAGAPLDFADPAFWSSRSDYVLALLCPLPADLTGSGGRAAIAAATACFVLAGLRASRRRGDPRVRRAWVLAAVWIALAFAAHAPVKFDSAGFRDVRYVFASLPGWSLALATALDALAVGRVRARVVVGGGAVATALLALAMLHVQRRWCEAGALARGVAADVRAALASGDGPVRVVGVPASWRGAHLGVGLTWLGRPPFLEPALAARVSVAPPAYLRHMGLERLGPLLELGAVLTSGAPGLRVLAWDAAERRVRPFPAAPREVIVRGAVARRGAGTFVACAGLPLDLAEAPPADAVLELRARVRTSKDGPRLQVLREKRVPRMLALEPRPEQRTLALRLEGDPHAAYVVYAGRDAALLPLPSTRCLLTRAPTPLATGLLDERGRGEVALAVAPERAQGTLFQAALLGPSGAVVLSECACLR